MFLPYVGVMGWKQAQPKIPWGTIVLFGVGISLGTALLLSAFLIVVHLGFASATALASAMIPIVIAVLQSVSTPGLNLIGMTMILQFVVSFGFILPVNAPQNMVAYGTGTFTARDFVKTGLVLTALGYALILVMAATWWPWLGLLTK